MRVIRVILSVAVALIARSAFGQGGIPTQGIRGLGGGPSMNFEGDLPSGSINRTLGYAGGYTTASQFTAPPTAYGGSYVTPAGIDVMLWRSGWQAVNFRTLSPGVGPGPLMGLKVRTIDSLNFDKRVRFAKLRETSMALADRIRQSDAATAEQLSLGFRQFMFPFPLQEKKELGYGFFSRMDLVGGGTVSPEAFLAAFTDEVQQSLGTKEFLEVTQAVVLGRALPEGAALDRLYDTQLAALGNYLFNNGRYGAAASVWAVLVQRDPTGSIAHRAAAACLFASGDLKRAVAETRASLKAAPGWPDALRIVGSNWQDVFRNARDLSEARAELEAQLGLKPDDPDLGFLMGYVDLFQGNWVAARERLGRLAESDEAARALAKALADKTVAATVERPAVAAVRGFIEEMTGLEEPVMSHEERRRLAEALREGPESYDDLMRIGDFRFFMGDFTLAGEAYRAAHKRKPEDAFALFMLVHACHANGEHQQAIRYLKAALAIEPNWGLYEFRLQEFYGDRSEYEQHLKRVERLVELRPENEDMKFLLAYVYYYSGRYSDAARLLSEIVRTEPDFAQAGYFLRLARLQG